MSSAKPLVFISYAHLDEPDNPAPGEVRWLSFVMDFLRPGEKGRRYTVWIDRLMPIGADWNPDIEAKIRTCDIFILLVSTHSTGSDYILDKEVPIVRERQRNGDGVHFCPLLIDWTPDSGLEQVDDKNLRPRDRKPFSSLSPSERSRAMAEVANEIAGFAKAIEDNKPATRKGDQSILIAPESAGVVGVVGAQDVTIGRLALGAPGESKPQVHPTVDLGRLPETGYERLVGRNVELARLDEAWSADRTNILSLIAEGGAGKSALVNEWLMRLQADGYRGAELVLGWSFYSQGSKERATAADEFLNWALAKLDLTTDTTSASAKGEAIAEAVIARRVLLVLDGVEPLQHGPGPQPGQLKDQGLRALLRRFATAPPRAGHSLIVLTSRLAVADLKRFKDATAPVVDVDKLSDDAGAELLRDNDIWGIDTELKAASRDFGGHPLALTLLASLIKETQNGDVRRRDHIRSLLADADNPRHDQARRVMESYEKEWLADQPALLAILHCVGLFDRPASADCLKTLRAKPAIRGLTDALVGLSYEQWRRAVVRLREVRLLAPLDPSDPEALDAHPLVREWFGGRARLTNEAAWKAAHSRLYDHLRKTTREGSAPTLAKLAPLYHAIAHGCRAGRYKEALEKIFKDRIYRRLPDGELEVYSFKSLGAASSNLAAISWFFDRPYEAPVAVLDEKDSGWVLNEAGYALRAQGRLQEAAPATLEASRVAEELGHWTNAAMGASTSSDLELLLGRLSAAAAMAEIAFDRARRVGDEFQMMVAKACEAEAAQAAGASEKAEALFAEAEQRQKKREPESPLLYSLQGYRYCDRFLSQGEPAEAARRAMQTIDVARFHNWVLPVVLDTMTIGRAHLAMALSRVATTPSQRRRDDGRSAAKLEEAVDGLREAGANEFVVDGLRARAAFRRAIGDWNRAAHDLNEAKEIAESAIMRLYLCDCALEGARLALARREAFAPLNGLVERSPPRPVPPDATPGAALGEEARKELDVARKLIAECGYHRRDAELAELDAVVAGGRRFADLPPRV
jgi:predicted N-acetyltransferase YhbS